jgi:threonine synthase
VAIVDSTAHSLKFSGFQEMYFENSFPAEFEISPDPDLINTPIYVHPDDLANVPAPGKPLHGKDFERFIQSVSSEIAKILSLKKR